MKGFIEGYKIKGRMDNISNKNWLVKKQTSFSAKLGLLARKKLKSLYDFWKSFIEKRTEVYKFYIYTPVIQRPNLYRSKRLNSDSFYNFIKITDERGRSGKYVARSVQHKITKNPNSRHQVHLDLSPSIQNQICFF